jgi:enoyl-CoA hydratase/carnithine racemase
MASIYSEFGHCRLIDFTAAEKQFIDLAEICDRIAWDEEARVVLVILGPEVNELLNRSLETSESPVLDSIAKLKQPVIAAIRGDAIDIGLELALSCDIRIGTENARFGLTQVKEGRIPSNGGTQRLPRIVGQGRALQMVLTGESIDAAEAHRIGLIHRVVAPELLMDTASGMAEEMAAKSPLSLSYAKEALYSSMDLTLDQGLRKELDLYLLLFTTLDRTEGIKAFREKREPKFTGN